MKIEVGKFYFRRDHLGPVQILEKITDDRYLADMGSDGEYYHYKIARKNATMYRENGEWVHAKDFKDGHAKDLVSEYKPQKGDKKMKKGDKKMKTLILCTFLPIWFVSLLAMLIMAFIALHDGMPAAAVIVVLNLISTVVLAFMLEVKVG